MSVTTQVTTFSDLYGDLINRVRITTGVTATDNVAKRFINIALQDMHLGWITAFRGLRGPLSSSRRRSTPPGPSPQRRGYGAHRAVHDLEHEHAFSVKNMRANGKIRIAGALNPYTIQTVSSDTAAVLTSKFTESTVTAGTYSYYEDEYDLASDFLRPVDAQRFSEDVSIDLISRTEFRRRYPANAVPNRPSVAASSTTRRAGTPRRFAGFKFHAPPSNQLHDPIYLSDGEPGPFPAPGVAQTGLSADTDEPIVPLRYRHAIVYHALYHWYRDKKDDARSAQAKGEYTDVLVRIASDFEVGCRASANPASRLGLCEPKRKARGAAGGGRRYDINGRLDRME